MCGPRLPTAGASSLQYNGVVATVLWIVVAYLVGSIPFGVIVARARGVDLRAVGSGNIGATNVSRALGRPLGVLVFALDALKGALPALLAGPEMAPFAGGAAILGHVFPCWLRFRGGKGVATASGAFIVILPVPTVVAAVVWVGTVLLTRYVSLGSILGSAALPTVALALGAGPMPTGFALAVAVLVWVRHRGNIRRLLAGTENRVGGGRGRGGSPPGGAADAG